MDRYLLTIVTLTAIAGCGEAAPEFLQGLIPVSGAMTWKGSPAPGAVLTFFPESGRPEKPEFYSSAVVSTDGTFWVRTTASRYLGEGIAPGNYVVTASWVKNVGQNPVDDDRVAESLPKKFQSPGTTPIRVTITESTRELDVIELTE